MSLVHPLFPGPLDVVGDVHGGLADLLALMERLGYDPGGRHPAGRRLVFVGDLVDRGEDSPAVCRLVQELIDAGRAQAILGNHELNLLLGKRRAGNEWFYGEKQYHQLNGGRVLAPQRLPSAGERQQLLAFFRGLPLALERPDLRVVHACWQAWAVNQASRARDVLQLHDGFRRALDLAAGGLGQAETAVARQNGNPVMVLTSGLEEQAERAFHAGGRARLVQRSRWWDRYQESAAVVFGHYWRSRDPARRTFHRGPDLFGAAPPASALGRRRNLWCVDFSNGRRGWEQRAFPWQEQTVATLAALRVPEMELAWADAPRSVPAR